MEYIENIVLSKIKDNFKHNISQENFSQSFFEAFTRIHQEQATYFDLLLKPANRTHFAEKLMTDVLPVFAERFRLPKKHPYSLYLADMYFATVVAAISHWLQQNRSLTLEDLSQLLGNVLTNGVVTVMSSCKDS
ncbi:TetR/AcrR family transcriptional regulator C-terminal domain-containing protein [bacterium]|nr:TetR/AcrR family transcriptional regulator C-terminal domain-containing protein [bacterium]